MEINKEPREIDFIIQSETWSEKDLADFRRLMKNIKRKNKLEKKSFSDDNKKVVKSSKIV